MRIRKVVMHAVLSTAAALLHPALAQESEWAPRQEIGLTLGRFFTTERGIPQGRLDLGSGTALQANYGYKLWEGDRAALFGEVHMLANPQRVVTSSDQTATRDVATLFVTPGIRLKFFPRSAISPYILAGGGYALYEQSLNRLDGRPNDAPRTTNRGVFDFGGGVDVKMWRFIGLRGEIRDFYAGSPAYNLPTLRGGQHNVVAGGGFVLKFK